MMKIVTKLAAAVLVTSLFISLLPAIDATAAEETDSYVTVDEFAEKVAKEIDATAVNGSFADGLIGIGIIKAGEFSSYDTDITRGDTMVLLNRADEYLGGTQVSSELVQTAIDKRISDISKVEEGKREDLAKAYLKGFMKGYSNGAYCTDRELKVTKKITKEGALSCIAMLKDMSKRAKISPDGQLIRTKNLPKYAKYYPYILESFPNAYYDWKFMFEGQGRRDPQTGIKTPYENIKDYAAPVDIDKISDFENFKEVRERNLDTWVKKVRTYLECVFNVDYRTIDDKWIEKVMTVDYTYGDEDYSKQTRERLQKYITDMKANKTIVESSKISVDGSTLYFYKGRYYLRTYIKYLIVSSNIKKNVDVDTLLQDKPFNAILFTRESPVDFMNFTVGKWREGYFDIDLGWLIEKEGERFGVYTAYFNDNYYGEGRVK
jgi:hypothetical protein